MKLHLAIFIVFYSMVVNAQSTAKPKSYKNCRPVEYHYYVADASPIKSFLLYDSIGRLVRDSFPSVQPGHQATYYGRSFEYEGDSINQYFVDSSTSYIRLAGNGMPLLEQQPSGVTYKVYYMPNGDLDRMEIVQPTINKQGHPDSIVSICDSIIYSKGNIVSFRARNNYPEGDEPLLLRIQDFTVTCSYYDVQTSTTDFYPLDKLIGLSVNVMGAWGGLNVSLFSKNLLKKMESSNNSVEFVYQFDDDGKVIEVSRSFKYNKQSFNTTDRYLIKYDCR